MSDISKIKLPNNSEYDIKDIKSGADILSLYNQNGESYTLIDLDDLQETVQKQSETITINSDGSRTFTATGTWARVAYPIYIPAGQMVVTMKLSNLTTSGYAKFFITSGTTTSTGQLVTVSLLSGMTSVYDTFTSVGQIYYVWFYMNYSETANTNSVTVSDFMIQTKASYDAEFTEYLPVTLPNYKLTPALVEYVDNNEKNKVQISLESGTYSSFVTTVSDGVITMTSGTALADPTVLIFSTIILPAGTYVISGCPDGGSDSSYRLDVRASGSTIANASTYNMSTGGVFTLSDRTVCSVCIRFKGNYSIPSSGLVFKPMICTLAAWNASRKFVPYNDYTPLTLSSSASGKISVKSGGYYKTGNLVVINAKIEVTTVISNNTYIFNTLPLPVAVSTGTSGYSVASIAATAMSSGINDTALALMLFNPTQPSGGSLTQGAIYTPGNHSGLPIGTYLLSGTYLAR